MRQTNLGSLSIVPDRDKSSLSKGQKAFNTLVRQIEKRRLHLNAWELVGPDFQKKYVDEFLPAETRCTDLKMKMVHCLDQACDRKGLTKPERKMISELIADLAAELIRERDDAQMKAVFNRHSEFDFDSEAEADLKEMKASLEEMLGTPLGEDIDMSSPEELLRRAEAKIEEQFAQEAAEREAREKNRSKRKMSAKQLAAQARQQEEQAQLSQSIREVYRKLASALHPDREPDPDERQRKTALMQRANQAYSKNNLLELLELQLELEHIDRNAIGNVSEDRLKHYNTILKEQLGELDQEIIHVEMRFRDTYGIPQYVDVSPNSVMRILQNDVAGMWQTVRDLEEDMLLFDDLKSLKAWLKAIKRRHAAIQFDTMPF